MTRCKDGENVCHQETSDTQQLREGTLNVNIIRMVTVAHEIVITQR